jgi:hypothetical protein
MKWYLTEDDGEMHGNTVKERGLILRTYIQHSFSDEISDVVSGRNVYGLQDYEIFILKTGILLTVCLTPYLTVIELPNISCTQDGT